jgi:hypothetical protein
MHGNIILFDLDRTLFNTEKFVDLSGSFGIDLSLPERVKWDSTIFRNCVYPETSTIIETLINNDYRVGIYTEGEYDFQKMKYRAVDLKGLFDKDLLFISNQKTLTNYIAKLPDGAIVVDDKVRVIDSLIHSQKEITPIWINRNSLEKHPKAKTIFELQELLQVI